MIRTPRPLTVVLLAAAVYYASSLVQLPTSEAELQGLPYAAAGRVAIAPPAVLSGDSPHYLATVYSLIEDGDFDLGNNYRQAEAGGKDLGRRFRGRPIDRHAEEDLQGRWRPVHSPFFALLLAFFAWPFRSTHWAEPICIWVSMGAALLAVFWTARHAEDARWGWALAFATPLWCYSRDLWTEAWVALLWVVLVGLRRPMPLFLVGVAGALIKYPFAVVPAVLGLLAWRDGQRPQAMALLSSSAVGLLSAFGLVQWLFADADHFSFFHSGIHAPFDWPFDGLVGLFFSPENGLLLFCPFLLWAIAPLRRETNILFPAAVFILVHAAYSDWMGGTGFSARYLVPILPLAVIVTGRARRESWIFRIALIYSALWGVLAGTAPALVYDRTPWGVLKHIWEKAW